MEFIPFRPCLILLCHTYYPSQMLGFLQIEGKTLLYQQKDYESFIALLALLQWSETEPSVFLRCACNPGPGK